MVLVSACGQPERGPSAAGSSAPRSSSMTTTTSSNASTPSVSTVAAQVFRPELQLVELTRGSNTIKVRLPQVTGGPAPARDRFNTGMHSALDDLAKQASDTSIEDGALAGDERSAVTTITPQVVAGVAIFTWYSRGAAHPNNTVATITIAVDSAEPILLADVFTDQQVAATRLADIVTRMNPDAAPLTSPVMDTFLNWVPTGAGFHVYVPVIHAMGDYLPMTIPWGQIEDLMTPQARAVLIP